MSLCVQMVVFVLFVLCGLLSFSLSWYCVYYSHAASYYLLQTCVKRYGVVRFVTSLLCAFSFLFVVGSVIVMMTTIVLTIFFNTLFCFVLILVFVLLLFGLIIVVIGSLTFLLLLRLLRLITICVCMFALIRIVIQAYSSLYCSHCPVMID